MVRINEHVLHQPKRSLVEIVRHHVQVGSANDLTLEGLRDLHAIRGHTDGLEVGSFHRHRGVGRARTRQVNTRASSPKMKPTAGTVARADSLPPSSLELLRSR